MKTQHGIPVNRRQKLGMSAVAVGFLVFLPLSDACGAGDDTPSSKAQSNSTTGAATSSGATATDTTGTNATGGATTSSSNGGNVTSGSNTTGAASTTGSTVTTGTATTGTTDSTSSTGPTSTSGSTVTTGTATTGTTGTTGPTSTSGSTVTTGTATTGTNGTTGRTTGTSGTTGRTTSTGSSGATSSTGGASNSTGSGGTTSTTASTGTTGTGGACVKGQTHGKDVAILGESFIALSTIPTELETLAKAQGSLPSGENYVNNAVSGTTIAGANGNVDQYNKAIASSGTIKYVIMDGGGNDCLQANNPTQALTGADKLFTLMASKNTEKVLYFFYADPIGSQFASLKTCLDTLRPQMKAKCDGLTAPKCYWLDLRPTWNGHTEYTSDGIHPTAAGSKATAAAIWPVAVANCIAQ